MHRKTIVINLVVLFLLTSVSAFAAGSGEKVKNKGVIMNRAGDALTVKTSEGTFTVTINSDTKVQHPVGLTGARKKQDSPDVLIPGLKINFEGVGGDQENQVIAKTITFDEDNLALAQVIQAGINPVAQQQASNMQTYATKQAATEAAIASAKEDIAATNKELDANKAQLDEVAKSTEQRLNDMGEVVTKSQYTVLFATGDYSLSPEYKQGLSDLAKQAAAYPKGWAISVAGYADSQGAAVYNQVLSRLRAQAVVAYLLQNCGVPVGRILAPGAMGETNPAASNESPSGRAGNRRVDVKLLLNKGVAGDM